MGKIMADETDHPSLLEDSPSVQVHLTILQNVIQRMASNSSSCKAWCITVVSAVLVMIADKGKPDFAFIALIPTGLFLLLDAYYLGLEKGSRASYDGFLKKLHYGSEKVEDMYIVDAKGGHSGYRLDALFFFSVWGFYVTLFVLILLTRSHVLDKAG